MKPPPRSHEVAIVSPLDGIGMVNLVLAGVIGLSRVVGPPTPPPVLLALDCGVDFDFECDFDLLVENGTFFGYYYFFRFLHECRCFLFTR